jgi:hypothetical protein
MLYLEQSEHWSFIPGPENLTVPTWSTQFYDPLLELKPAVVAAGILRIPGTKLIKPNDPTWWEWSAIWENQDRYIGLNMTLMGDDDDFWGGCEIECACTVHDFLCFWKELRMLSPRIYVHSPECRVFTLDEFELEKKD